MFGLENITVVLYLLANVVALGLVSMAFFEIINALLQFRSRAFLRTLSRMLNSRQLAQEINRVFAIRIKGGKNRVLPAQLVDGSAEELRTVWYAIFARNWDFAGAGSVAALRTAVADTLAESSEYRPNDVFTAAIAAATNPSDLAWTIKKHLPTGTLRENLLTALSDWETAHRPTTFQENLQQRIARESGLENLRQLLFSDSVTGFDLGVRLDQLYATLHTEFNRFYFRQTRLIVTLIASCVILITNSDAFRLYEFWGKYESRRALVDQFAGEVTKQLATRYLVNEELVVGTEPILVQNYAVIEEFRNLEWQIEKLNRSYPTWAEEELDRGMPFWFGKIAGLLMMILIVSLTAQVFRSILIASLRKRFGLNIR
ncbi:MAG: hypothetical protein AAGN35_08130 [Bacteroidota bacterium]